MKQEEGATTQKLAGLGLSEISTEVIEQVLPSSSIFGHLLKPAALVTVKGDPYSAEDRCEVLHNDMDKVAKDVG
jgi:hypothetical protein